MLGNNGMNPVVKVAGMFPVYSNSEPIKPRLSLGNIRRRVPGDGEPTGKSKIKASIPMGKIIPFSLRRRTQPSRRRKLW